MNPATSPKISPETPAFGCSRYAPVQFLPGATKFSEDSLLCDPVQIVRLLRRFPQITRQLKAATEPLYTGGRKRMRGDWSLVFLAYMITGLGDMDRFHKRWASSGLWKAAGFKEAPSGPTLYLRFVELEEYHEAFEQAAHELMRRARQHEPMVGRAVHVDGTGISTHAALEHFCPAGRGCKRAEKAGRVPRVGDDLVGDIRAEENDRPEDAVEAEPSNALMRLTDAEVAGLGFATEHLSWGQTKERPFAWFKQGDHYYRLRDTTASPRAYKSTGRKTRFWNGWNDITVTDAFTGAPMVIEVTTAREQEWAVYPDALTKTHEALGLWPQLVSADRGFVTKDTYEFNTRRGIGSALPWREPRPGVRRRHLESEEFDRHGIMRCQHCGGPCDMRSAGLGFYMDERDEPRVRGRCRIGGTDDCKETQSVACAREWRYLQPLALTDEVFHQLTHSHPSTERVHLHLRGRYTQGGKETVMRNKRFGIGCQKLRAAAVLFLEWFRLCLRNGWLGSHKLRNESAPRIRNAGERLAKVIKARLQSAIDLPYGEAARRAGLGKHGPPGPESPRRKKRK